MINKILMELYDDYENSKNDDKLIEFAKKTFPSDGTDKLFIGCVLIMFSLAGGFKPRYDCTRENLVSIVSLAKEKIAKSNLLAFYIDRVNKTKGINEYLTDIINDINLDKYADTIIEYLEKFKPDVISMVKNHNSLNSYINGLK